MKTRLRSASPAVSGNAVGPSGSADQHARCRHLRRHLCGAPPAVGRGRHPGRLNHLIRCSLAAPRVAESFALLPRCAEDLAHAVDWLCAQAEVDAHRVGVIGHSVGAAAALLLASQRQDLVAAVTLAAFADPAAIMRRWLKAQRIPYWPLGA
ncbi:alpha/beta fold hydrolase [Accumulibacter sp.]|uniref:alpha/beta fold hydrolase n=1 Tax=Accumulibacter sp. TaxID=2053492 RepID=UPI00342D9DC4